MTATINEKAARPESQAAESDQIESLVPDSKGSERFPKAISSPSTAERKLDYLAINPKKGSAASEQLRAKKATTALKEKCGAEWQGGRLIDKKWQHPDRAFYAIHKDNRQEFEGFLEENNISIDEIELVSTWSNPKHLKKVSRLSNKVESTRQNIKRLELKRLKEIHDADIMFSADEITREEHQQRLQEINSRYDEQRKPLESKAGKLEDVEMDALKELLQRGNGPKPFSKEELIKAIDDNECGDASLFKKLCGKEFLFDPDEKIFYLWNGTTWTIDKNKTRHRKLEIVATCYSDEADLISSTLDEKDKAANKLSKSLYERSKALKTTRRMGAVLEMATVGAFGDGGLTFNGQWDSCPGFLPCANGLIDLKDGRLVESSRCHFIRKQSPIKYDPSAQCPLFEKFVYEIMGDNADLAKFLQRLFGYASIGNPIEHIFVFLHGEKGRNGKGTLIRTLSKVLGHITREFPSELLLLQRNPPSSGTPRPELVHLQGARFALFSEINEGRKIDSAVLKNLSGGDTIAARSLFSNEIKNFPPTHTIFLQANHCPKAPANDVALWRRAIRIRFDMNFVETPDPSNPRERLINPHVEEKLLVESEGILRWIVEGAVEYKNGGLCVPQEVREAVEEYRSENDGIGTFIREKCVLDKTLSAKKGVLTESIKAFCVSEDFKVPTRNEISKYLKQKGFEERHNMYGDWWMGISIRPTPSDSEQ